MSFTLSKLLSNISTLSSTESIIELSPTLDPELKGFLRDGFFLSTIILFFLYILKLIYLVMILCNVLWAEDKEEVAKYPGPCNLTCEVIHAILMILGICVGIASCLSTFSTEYRLIMSTIYLTGIAGSLIRDYIAMISICDSKVHNEYTLGFGLISMIIVINECLSLTIGCFYAYYLFFDWKYENKDKNIQFLP